MFASVMASCVLSPSFHSLASNAITAEGEEVLKEAAEESGARIFF